MASGRTDDSGDRPEPTLLPLASRTFERLRAEVEPLVRLGEASLTVFAGRDRVADARASWRFTPRFTLDRIEASGARRRRPRRPAV